jgi:hypothetical protein
VIGGRGRIVRSLHVGGAAHVHIGPCGKSDERDFAAGCGWDVALR